jgi:hypothetical protein
MVYNNEFVEKNFTKATDLKGVFTLGEAQQAQLDQIADTKAEIARLEALRCEIALYLTTCLHST